MANKPRIYGYCKAGSTWEVPHKSDLDNVAAFIEVPFDESGIATLEPYKKYRIFCEENDNVVSEFDAKITITAGNFSYEIEVDKPFTYTKKDNFDFEFWGLTSAYVLASSIWTVDFAWTINGGDLQRRTAELNTDPQITGEPVITVSGATKVLLVNDNAAVRVPSDVFYVSDENPSGAVKGSLSGGKVFFCESENEAYEGFRFGEGDTFIDQSGTSNTMECHGSQIHQSYDGSRSRIDINADEVYINGKLVNFINQAIITVASEDELPTDAADGTIAIVES